MMRFSSPTPQVIEAAMKKVGDFVKENGGRDLRVAKDERENTKLWGARKAQYWSQQLLVGEGCRVLVRDALKYSDARVCMADGPYRRLQISASLSRDWRSSSNALTNSLKLRDCSLR